jgi:hypothetical protein
MHPRLTVREVEALVKQKSTDLHTKVFLQVTNDRRFLIT